MNHKPEFPSYYLPIREVFEKVIGFKLDPNEKIIINNDNYKIIYKSVQEYPGTIEFIENPPEEFKLIAVSSNGNVIKHLENPSEKVQLQAVYENPFSIKYIKNPSEAVQLSAVKLNGFAIEHIKNPSEAVQLAAIYQDSGSIQYIENPSEHLQLEIVKIDPRSIIYINNLFFSAILIAVGKDLSLMKFINVENLTPSQMNEINSILEIHDILDEK